MATVPTAVAPSVMPTPSTGLPYQNANGATPDAFGAGIGQAIQGLGQQIGATGNMLEKHADKMQEDLNTTHSEDLFLKGSTELGQLSEQYKSLEGQARVNALPKFMDDVAGVRAKYLDQAPNPAVKSQLDQLMSRQLGYTVREAGGLAGQATRQYMKQTSQSVQANSLDQIAKNSNDDQQFLSNTQTGLESKRKQPDYQGASPDTQKEMDRDFVSTAWATRLQSMSVDGDPKRALSLFNQNKDSISSDAQLKLEPLIKQSIITKGVPVDSDKIIQQVGIGSMEDRVKKLEGYSEKPYSDFKQTSSGYGTKAQPGDENIPPDQRQAVYSQRLRNELSSAYQIVDNFAPGLPKGARDALADLTYNAGSAWTTSGLGIAVRHGDMEGAKRILPQYNQAGGQVNQGLVDRRAQELSWWNNDTGPANADPTTLMSRALDKSKETAAAAFPDPKDSFYRAKYEDTLNSRLSTDLGLMQRTARDMQVQAMGQINKEIYADPNNPMTSLDKLSPQAQSTYMSLPDAARKNVDASLRSNSAREKMPTQQQQDNWDRLYAESREHPDQFMARNPDDMDLSNARRSKMVAMQADRKALLARGPVMAPIMSHIQPLLNDAQIFKSKNPDAKDNNDQYLKFSGVMEQQVNEMMQEKKRPLTMKEVDEIATPLVKKLVTSPHWYGDEASLGYQAVADHTPIELQGSTDEEKAAHVASLPRGATISINGKKFVKR